MTDKDPYEEAGRAVYSLIESRRAQKAAGDAEIAYRLGLAPAPAEQEQVDDPVRGSWTAEEWDDLQRRKAEHAAQVAEREAAAINQTGRGV